jgi:SAM-dependent methyltransferase
VQIALTPEGGASGSKGSWEVFRVVSYNPADGAWTEHCTGLVSAEMEKGPDQFEVELDQEHVTGILDDIEARSTVPVDVQKFYDDVAASGNVFGPTFRAVRTIKVGDHHAHGCVALPDTAASMPAQFSQPHIAHPATLDALNHMAAVLYMRHCENSPFVAASIDELSVSASITSVAGAELVVACRMDKGGSRSARGNTWVFQHPEAGVRPVITISGWRLQAIGESRQTGDAVPFDRDMTYRMEWRADVDQLTNQAFMGHLSKMGLFGIGYKPQFGVLGSMFYRETAALHLIRRAVNWMEENGKQVDNESPHISKLYEWMQRVSKPENSDLVPIIPSVSDELPDTGAEDFVIAQAALTGAQGEMLVRIGNKLPDILTGSVKSLSLMFEDNLLERLYGEDMMQSGEVQMAEYIKLLSFKYPRMKVLEIGAGTGGASLPILQALDDSVDGLLFDRYCYTDISSGFFEKARAKFAHWERRMDFKTLDVSKDPLHQGFEEQQFDLIIAANVLHATPSLDVTVANCRKLLKNGGRMILMEVSRLTLTINTIFGTLPGWWMSEDGRKDTPTISVADWDKVVRRHGFEGVEIASPDHQGETAVMWAMVCKADAHSTQENGVAAPSVVILSRNGSATGQLLAEPLCQSLRRQAIDASTQDIGTFEVQSDSSYIVLDAGEASLLKDPSAAEFTVIQRLATQAKNVLWVSTQSSESAEAAAAKGMINGLARVTRHENPYIKLVTLDVRDTLPESPRPVSGHLAENQLRRESMRSKTDKSSFRGCGPTTNSTAGWRAREPIASKRTSQNTETTNGRSNSGLRHPVYSTRFALSTMKSRSGRLHPTSWN